MSVVVEFWIKQGDLLPTVQATLKDAADTVWDLTGATVKFLMRSLTSEVVKVNATADILDAVNRKVEYKWVGTDTDTVALFEVEWEVTFPSGKKETFPGDRYNIIEVVEQIA
jgi:hypothetical protein